jgi:hypothetical protein
MFSGYSEDFALFWNAYPRRIAKGAAWNAWQKLQPDPELQEQILHSIADHLDADEQWREVRYIPHPATFLNQRRFEDELQPARPQVSDRTLRLMQAGADFSASFSTIKSSKRFSHG